MRRKSFRLLYNCLGTYFEISLYRIDSLIYGIHKLEVLRRMKLCSIRHIRRFLRNLLFLFYRCDLSLRLMIQKVKFIENVIDIVY